MLPIFRILPYFYGKTHLRPLSGNFCNLYGKNKMGPPAKRKPARFLSSWTLPPGITASSKGPSFAYCKFCKDNFSICLCTDFFFGLPCVFVSYAYEMYRNSIPCLAISVSILVFLDLLTSYFMIIFKKCDLFWRKNSTQIWSKILKKS